MSSVAGERPAGEDGQLARRAHAACEVTIVAHDIDCTRGMERQLSELLLGLTRLGHRVTVIARRCELPAGAQVVFHRVRGPGRPFLIAYPWFMLAGSLAVRRWRRGVVQATGAIVLGRVDVLAVHYCHQVATPTPSRSTWLFRAHVKLAGMLKRIGERVCFRVNRPRAVVCVSEGVADEIREHFPALAGRVLTIHNGIDTATFAPGAHHSQARAMRSSLGIPEGRLVAAFVAGEWERKGLAPLIHSLALAREWDLVVAGAGHEQHYRKLSDSLGVGERIHWLGVTRQVQLVYEHADAFVLPTSYETFSLVTFEAAANGLPILVTPVNGVRELIEDGHNGFLITPEPREIAARLSQLAGDPALRERLGQAARRSALGFSSQRMVSAHHELYTRLAGAART
ncbi:MAG TPA: glycosyltransferase family 4 protein [Solirubrobacteraceae bacterium]|nr:glycosyltransferase family 4 protein [Solirubrobacteraceae bacterium]